VTASKGTNVEARGNGGEKAELCNAGFAIARSSRRVVQEAMGDLEVFAEPFGSVPPPAQDRLDHEADADLDGPRYRSRRSTEYGRVIHRWPGSQA
jgi:hypothetical protein